MLRNPNPPYQCPVEHWDRYRNNEIDLPKVASIPEEDADPYSTRLREEVSLRGVELTAEQIRKARHGYYGAASYVDDLVGEVLEALRASNQEKNTVVIFTSDHGDMLGERGLWYKKLFFEDACRVPMLVHFPQRFAANRVTANVSHVDLLPTFLELADPEAHIEHVDRLDGTSTSFTTECCATVASSTSGSMNRSCSQKDALPSMRTRRGDDSTRRSRRQRSFSFPSFMADGRDPCQAWAMNTIDPVIGHPIRYRTERHALWA